MRSIKMLKTNSLFTQCLRIHLVFTLLISPQRFITSVKTHQFLGTLLINTQLIKLINEIRANIYYHIIYTF